MKYTDEELAMLTDEERAAIAEGENFDEDTEEELDPNTGEPIASDDDQDDDGEEADDADEEGPGDETGDKDEGEGEQPGRDDGGDTTDEPAPQTPAAPVQHTALPEDFQQQMDAVAQEKEALYVQFDEGDLTTTEYAKQLDELNKRERHLERIKDRAELETQQRYSYWQNVTVAGFLAQHKEYEGNDVLLNMLDAEVRKLQGRSENDTDPKILELAHETIKKALPQVFSADPASTPKTKTRRAHKTAPSLANIPASNVDTPGADEFEHLDRLFNTNPLRYEQELAKLQASNPAKFDQYMAS